MFVYNGIAKLMMINYFFSLGSKIILKLKSVYASSS